MPSSRLVGPSNQVASNPSTLTRFIHGQIREIRAEVKICDCSRDSDKKPIGVPCRHDHVGPAKHPFDCLEVVDRPALGQRGAMKQVQELVGGEPRLDRVAEGFRGGNSRVVQRDNLQEIAGEG